MLSREAADFDCSAQSAFVFGAALFSTVSRESGNLWSTLVLSSIALILATLVGLTTVPQLARRVVSGSLSDAVDYEVTRTGIVYALVTVVISVAALNTRNNLLYIVVAAMLAAILISGIASAPVIRRVPLISVALRRAALGVSHFAFLR
jgi:hypothetical protein